jgi:hypothetical protein
VFIQKKKKAKQFAMASVFLREWQPKSPLIIKIGRKKKSEKYFIYFLGE